MLFRSYSYVTNTQKATADKEAAEEEIIETPVAEIVDPEPSEEDKEK